jgi:cytochrome c oxidase subunit I
MLGSAPYRDPAWNPMLWEMLFGVFLLTISSILFYLVIVGTITLGKRLKEEIEMPIAESLDADAETPGWLNNWQPWLYGALALILFGYGPMLYQLINEMQLNPLLPDRVW